MFNMQCHSFCLLGTELCHLVHLSKVHDQDLSRCGMTTWQGTVDKGWLIDKILASQSLLVLVAGTICVYFFTSYY